MKKQLHWAAAVAVMLMAASSARAGLSIVPDTFDFGWAPDNAKISAEFAVKNDGAEVIPLTSVQPTCGCTASNFTPSNLATNETTKIGLTFNTRGYRGIPFNKSTKVKTDASGAEYTVYLKGKVMDPDAKVVPEGDGIASFEPDSKEKHRKITIKNNNSVPVTVEIIQKTADWAKAKLSDKTIAPNGSITLDISAGGPYTEVRTTSLTIEAKGGTNPQHLTIAVRTGPAPVSMRPPAPAPTATTPPSATTPEAVKPAAPTTPPAPSATDKTKK